MEAIKMLAVQPLEINEEVTLRVRFWYTGVEEIDYAQHPDFFAVLTARRNELGAAMKKWVIRSNKAVESWSKDQENLESHHGFSRSMAIANRNYDKKVRANDKRYNKAKAAIYAKYEPVFKSTC